VDIMKRFLTFTLAILIILSPVSILSGCGGPEDEARSYMKKGDEIVVAVEKNSKTLVTKMDTTFSDLYKQINAGNTPDTAAFDKSSKEITALVKVMLDKASLAKADYGKILRLESVPYYVKYARNKIKVIDFNVQGLKQLQEFLAEGKNRLTAQPFDPVAFQIAVVQFSDGIKKLGEESGKLQKQAEDLKKENKL
jgi:hypothetical protein